MFGGCKLGGHDEFLHVAPGEVRCEEATEGKGEFDGLLKKLRVFTFKLGHHAVVATSVRLKHAAVVAVDTCSGSVVAVGDISTATAIVMTVVMRGAFNKRLRFTF